MASCFQSDKSCYRIFQCIDTRYPEDVLSSHRSNIETVLALKVKEQQTESKLKIFKIFFHELHRFHKITKNSMFKRF
jgi:hypothetical protein